METGELMDMVEVFEGLEDWRNARQTRHRLSEMLTVAVCAVLSGADDFQDISQWARIKLPWLRRLLSLDYVSPRPTPSSASLLRCKYSAVVLMAAKHFNQSAQLVLGY